MANFNKVILAGNATRDPELRSGHSGNAVASLGLAINRTWKDAEGESKEEVAFIDCVAFGRIAEVAGQYVKKGNPLLVEGRLKQESWEDKQTGQKRSRLVVVIEHLVLMGGQGEESKALATNRQPAPSKPASAPAAPARQPPPARLASQWAPPEDDVPF